MTLADVLQAHPELSARGFKTYGVSAEKHVTHRQITPELEAEFEAARSILSRARTTKVPKHSSYYIKPQLEKMAQQRISTGACIAAAYAAGITVGTEHLGVSRDALFGLHSADLRKWILCS